MECRCAGFAARDLLVAIEAKQLDDFGYQVEVILRDYTTGIACLVAEPRSLNRERQMES